jgi:hypothetical protein
LSFAKGLVLIWMQLMTCTLGVRERLHGKANLISSKLSMLQKDANDTED